jgi:membrane protein implicated in regulation of membrane protease activity
MALLRYTLLRLALLAVTAGVLYLVGLRDMWLLVGAFLVSGLISLFVLSKARDDVSVRIAERQSAIDARLQQPPSAEHQPDGEPDR